MPSTMKCPLKRDYLFFWGLELIDSDNGWCPYFSLEDAHRLDDVRLALRAGGLRSASQIGRIFSLKPIAVQLLFPKNYLEAICQK